jgi:hypothetical protein
VPLGAERENMAGDEKEKAAPASATELQRVKKLESIVKRQRDVVREQQASITALMEHVDELQAKIASKDAEIIALQERGDVQQDQKAAAAAASHGDGGTEEATKLLQQELQRQEQTVQKVQDQLAAAHERERALQLHIAQLQRKNLLAPVCRHKAAPTPARSAPVPGQRSAVQLKSRAVSCSASPDMLRILGSQAPPWQSAQLHRFPVPSLLPCSRDLTLLRRKHRARHRILQTVLGALAWHRLFRRPLGQVRIPSPGRNNSGRCATTYWQRKWQ